MCHINSGKVSVVLEVILGEGEYKHKNKGVSCQQVLGTMGKVE